MDVIKNMGICGSPIASDVSQPMVATKDIAAVAASRLSGLEIKGHAIEYILGPRNLSYTDVTRALALRYLDVDTVSTCATPTASAQRASRRCRLLLPAVVGAQHRRWLR